MAPPAAAQRQICQDVGIDDDQGRPSRLEGRISWLNGVDTAALHLASVTLGEIEAGIELTREQNPAKAAEIEQWLDQVSCTYNIIPMDGPAFRCHRQWFTSSPWSPETWLTSAALR